MDDASSLPPRPAPGVAGPPRDLCLHTAQHRAAPALRPAAALRVAFVALPLPRVDGLPDGAESTNNVPSDKFELHWKAFDGLAAPFAEFLAAACADEGSKPDWFIVDIFHHWAAAAAVEHRVPCAMLMLNAAYSIAGWSPQVAASAAEPRYESKLRAQQFHNHGASGMSVVQRISLTFERCTLAAIRSCIEWEPESVPLVKTKLRSKTVVPIGLLLPPPDGGRSVNGDEGAAVRWLDAQPANSVVYVALGSEAPLGAEQVHELALGLELSGARFLWALRKPSGVDDAEVLPPGIDESTRGRGLVTTGWVPQVSVLAHGPVGAFLTHCGWSSTIEGLMFSRPLIMMPIYGDQGPNARLMEGKKIGLQVPRDEDDGSFDREGVASAVRAVMAEEETRAVFVANAKKLQEIVDHTELHENYIDGFIQQLGSLKA
ncbi:hypothetical protein ACP4OV_008526 [Aristida adscensionis]